VPLRSGRASITGIAKGSGMIHPQLATMLVYLLTDVGATPAELKVALRKSCADSFNVISVDGDTSTNDTVLLLASGESGISLRSVRKEFDAALLQVCRSLAEQVARTIAHSLLVKTAWAGADPNWGRILAAVGRSGIRLNLRKTDVLIGDQTVCRGAVACRFDEQLAHQELSKAECRVSVRLGSGKASVEFLTTDLTQEYVRINADYST
jgi:glutamate N-acetyltransferase/amino-acid N-acetyltransferase